MSHDLVFNCLLFMLLLGPTQVIMAMIWLSCTKYASRRKHFLIYLAGVSVYFIAMALWEVPGRSVYDYPAYQLFYFGGAGLLAFYHLLICCYGHMWQRESVA